MGCAWWARAGQGWRMGSSRRVSRLLDGNGTGGSRRCEDEGRRQARAHRMAGVLRFWRVLRTAGVTGIHACSSRRPNRASASGRECLHKPREIPGREAISTEGRCEETLFTHSLWQRRGDASSGANELTGRVSKQACRVTRGEGVRGQQREGAASGARRAGGRERRGGRGEASGALGRDTPSTRYGEKYGEIWGEICERRAFDEQGSNAE